MMRAVIFTILALMPTIAMADGHGYKVEDKFNFESADGIYDFEIRVLSEKTKIQAYKGTKGGKERPSIANIKLAKREIHIECVDKCICKNAYHEELGNGSGWPAGAGLLGMFLVEDGSRHLVTTWVTDAQYNVELYGCENGRLGRVLAIGSRTLPEISHDGNGMPVVKYSPDYDHPESSATLHWNGHSYSAE